LQLAGRAGLLDRVAMHLCLAAQDSAEVSAWVRAMEPMMGTHSGACRNDMSKTRAHG
jgi:hypothetical protein